MNFYEQIISEATGVTDKKELYEIEDCMRNDIFHSNLDWQTKAQLKKAAIEAVFIVKEVKKMLAGGKY